MEFLQKFLFASGCVDFSKMEEKSECKIGSETVPCVVIGKDTFVAAKVVAQVPEFDLRSGQEMVSVFESTANFNPNLN